MIFLKKDYGPERIPGLRQQIDGVFRQRLYARSGTRSWPEQADPAAIQYEYEQMDNDDVYELAPFSTVILNPPAERDMDTMAQFKRKLDATLTTKDMNAWANHLIDTILDQLHPRKRWM